MSDTHVMQGLCLQCRRDDCFGRVGGSAAARLLATFVCCVEVRFGARTIRKRPGQGGVQASPGHAAAGRIAATVGCGASLWRPLRARGTLYRRWIRIPGASSGDPMNSMPASSRVLRSAAKFARVIEPMPSSVSALLMVLVLTAECAASSRTDQRSALRAILICTAVNVDEGVI